MQSADSIEYSIYFPTPIQDEKKLLADILAYSSTLSAKYCWHSHSRFSLSPSSASTHFSGKVFYSDCINDEYFTIYLLHAISLKHPSACILHFDTHDGQILLIDAADCLPDWITPETSDNRVWIKNGRLHLIPQDIKVLSPSQAIHALSDDTLASSELELKAFSRVLQFDEIDDKFTHKTSLALPIQIANMLAQLEAATLLLHLAIQCYYTEPTPGRIQRRAIDRAGVNTNVNLHVSRTRYAQLYHSRPPADGMKEDVDKKAEMVDKIIVGFEILARREARETVYSLEWDGFLGYLTKEIGYFGDEIEGSKEYRARFDRAVEEFMEGRVDWKEVVGPGLGKPTQEYKEVESGKDDEEAWMWISEEELNSTLKEGYSGEKKEGGVEDEMREITGDFDRFINVESGLDGVVFEEEDSDDDAPIEFDGDRYIATLKAMCEEKKEVASDDRGAEGEDASNSDSDDEETIEDYMKSMDTELGDSKTVGETFGDTLDENGEVDVSINLLRNIVTSSIDQSNTGEFGPYDSILQGMKAKR